MFTHVLSAPPDTSPRTNWKQFISNFVIPFFISLQLAATLHELLPIERKILRSRQQVQSFPIKISEPRTPAQSKEKCRVVQSNGIN